MTTPTMIFTAVLGTAFLAAGLPKVLRTEYFRGRIRHWQLPTALLPAIGLVELAGAALLLAGAMAGERLPAIAGASLLVATMLGALTTHVRIADPAKELLNAGVLGALVLSDLLVVVV